ncbi:glutathione binding-like protein, partial [Alphaproteobacteria bacterium]|nr:glutathione binding-like protein [Alphaproteobacteria bacterium]
KMRDGVRKSNDKINTEMGLESPLLLPSIKAFKHLFSDMNKHLQTHDWLAGESYSLADISLVVYLTRLGSFQMAPLWADMTALNNWFDKIVARPAYQKAVIDWGDITAEKRRSEGITAFEEVKKLWQQES